MMTGDVQVGAPSSADDVHRTAAHIQVAGCDGSDNDVI